MTFARAVDITIAQRLEASLKDDILAAPHSKKLAQPPLGPDHLSGNVFRPTLMLLAMSEDNNVCVRVSPGEGSGEMMKECFASLSVRLGMCHVYAALSFEDPTVSSGSSGDREW